MNEIQRPKSCIGSLTPQLEGAACSASHPERTQPDPNSKTQKGGKNHE